MSLTVKTTIPVSPGGCLENAALARKHSCKGWKSTGCSRKSANLASVLQEAVNRGFNVLFCCFIVHANVFSWSRLAHKDANESCLKLWPELHPHRDSPSLTFTAVLESASRSFPSRGTISVQLWVSYPIFSSDSSLKILSGRKEVAGFTQTAVMEEAKLSDIMPRFNIYSCFFNVTSAQCLHWR